MLRDNHRLTMGFCDIAKVLVLSKLDSETGQQTQAVYRLFISKFHN